MVMIVAVMFVWTLAYLAQRTLEGKDGRTLDSVLVEELINKTDYITSSGGVISVDARVDLQVEFNSFFLRKKTYILSLRNQTERVSGTIPISLTRVLRATERVSLFQT